MLFNEEQEIELEETFSSQNKQKLQENQLLETQHQTIYKVLQNECEGEIKIVEIECLKQSSLKFLLCFILSIASGFLFLILLIAFPQLQRYFCYKVSELNNCSHFYLILNKKEKKHQIVKKTSFNPTQFIFENLTYCFSQKYNRFYPLTLFYLSSTTNSEMWQYFRKQIQETEDNIKKFGKNIMDVPLPKYLSWMGVEVIRPFNILVYINVASQIAQSPTSGKLALLNICSILVFLTIAFIQHRKSTVLIKKEMTYNTEIKLLKNQVIQTMSYKDAAPGDIMLIEEGMTITCDLVLMKGEVLLNEAIITGESIPQQKAFLEDNGETFSYQENKINILFEGTNVVQIMPSNQNEQVYAMVLRTGFTTLKGQYMRQLLFSHQSENFKFFKQILKFTIFFAIISSILFFLSLKALLGQENSTYFIVWKGIEAITQSFPPLIQIFFLWNILIVKLRLKDKGILTLQQHRIVEAGQLTTICFDKTGTLTEDSVKIIGIEQKDFKANKFLELQVSPNFENQTKENNLLQLVLATCNNLSLSNNKIIGEILEREMLAYSKMQLFYHDRQKIYHQLNSEDFSYQTLKTFGFESKLQRMSVITKDLIQDQIYLTSKGSPEQIKILCDQQTLPDDYDEIMLKFNLQGYRLISLAFKQISQNEFNTCIIDLIIYFVLDNTRDKFENNLCFLGFLILENTLKADATSIISSLNQIKLNIKVVSGDNIYTALQTAKSCNIIEELQDVFVCDYNSQTQSVSITQYPKLAEKSMQNLLNNLTSKTVTAMTGPFFEYILQSSYPSIHISNLILHSTIFGRMTPTMKQSLIIYLQKQNEICAMVGDGANDSQAIAAANVGIAIANTSASFSAQFIVQKLDSIIELIQEGTALIVTNLDLYKMQTTIYFIWMTVGMFLAQIGYYYIFFHQVFTGNLPFFAFLLFPLTKPIAKLTAKKPNLNMASKQHFLSILGIMGFAALGQKILFLLSLIELILIYFYMNSNNTFSTGIKNNNFQVGGIPGTFFFGIHPLLELAEVIAFYTHNPFKEKIFKNYCLLFYLSIPFILLNIVNMFPSIAPEFIGLVTLPINQRVFIVIISNGFFLLMYCYQEILVQKIN